MTETTQRKSTFKCPDCQSRARITTTKQVTSTVKEFHVCCTNDDCGGRYIFMSEPIRVVVPSLMPNPTLNLPGRSRDNPDPTSQGQAL